MSKIQKPIAHLLMVCIFHNSIAAFYLLTMAAFFVPFPTFADTFLDKAAEGEALGSSLMSTFTVPNVDGGTGQITLTNGLAAGQSIEQDEMFQEIQPGSMDAAAAAYGDAGAQGNYVNNNINGLTTGSTQHAYAYQTLMGANTAMPNMMNDPIWKQSDDVFTRTSPLIDDMFNGCQKTTNWGQKSCSIHMEDLKQCRKTLKTQQCKVTRVLTYDPVMGFTSGDGNFETCGLGCIRLNLGVDTDNNWQEDNGCTLHNRTATWRVLRPDAIRKVTIEYVKWDDETKIFINGNWVYTGHNGWGGVCEQDTSWSESPNTDITSYFKSVAPGSLVTIRQDVRVGGYGEGFAKIKVEAAPDMREDFIDNPSGCRQRLFDAWPTVGTVPTFTDLFVSSGSLNDEASTQWWQCTEASNSKVVGPITLTPSNYRDYTLDTPILPAAPTVPPAPICYKAETRILGTLSFGCYTDYQGYEICPEHEYNPNEHNTCDSLSSCAYVKEACAKDEYGNVLTDPVTGTCKDFIVTYDCGTDHDSTCDVTNNGENTICDAQIRCMGGECVNPRQESNEDFIKAATALQTINETQKQMSCEDPTQGACKFFVGEAYTCQMADMSILGSVDCCNMPIGGSWIDYIWLAQHTWELADTSVQMYSMASSGGLLTNTVGAWNLVSTGTVFQTPVGMMGDAYTAITDTFTSMYDSVATMLGEKIGVNLGLAAIKQQAMQWIADWVFEQFGQQAVNLIFTTVGSSATSAGVVTGASALVSSIVTVVGIIYAVYQIGKMVVQMVFACTEEEIKLQMYRNQKFCTKPDEIGTYCSARFLGACVAHKQAYCCFSSPFTRVFQEQARTQLHKTFGKPKTPSCEGFTMEELATLDFDKMDFSEWVDMLKVANVMPLNDAKIDELYNINMMTTGNLPETNTFDIIDRIQIQTDETDIDEQRQHLIDNL